VCADLGGGVWQVDRADTVFVDVHSVEAGYLGNDRSEREEAEPTCPLAGLRSPTLAEVQLDGHATG
jgi:hypothetical protein